MAVRVRSDAIRPAPGVPLDDLDEAVRLNPLSTGVYAARGMAFFNLGQHERAIADLDAAIRLQPRNSRSIIDRGMAHIGLGQYNEALKDFNLAIDYHGGNLAKDNPAFFLSHYGRGLAHFNLGNYEPAVKDLTSAITRSGISNLPEAYIIRGISYGQLGRIDLAQKDLAPFVKAVENLERGLRLNPQRSQVYSTRGLAFLYLDQNLRSVAYFDQAISLDPKNSSAFVGRAAANTFLDRHQLVVEDVDEALKIFEVLLTLSGDSRVASHALFLQGQAYQNLGQPQNAALSMTRSLNLGLSDGPSVQANLVVGNSKPDARLYPLDIYSYDIPELNQAIHINPQDAHSYFLRGLTYLSLERNSQALQDLDQAILLDPNEPKYYAIRGDIRSRIGDSEKALIDYSMAVKLRSVGAMSDSDNPIDTSPEAIAALDQAVRQEPRDDQVYMDRGLTYLSLGQNDLALEDFDKAISNSSGNLYLGSSKFFTYFFSRGLANFNLGRYEEAVKDLTAAIERFDHPDFPEAYIIRGISYGQLGRIDLAQKDLAPFVKAVENLERGLRLNPQRSQVYSTRGLAFLHLGQNLRSVAYFDQAISLDPTNLLFAEALRLAKSHLAVR
jgi:tetratricopeptide (TPR) repeat protein